MADRPTPRDTPSRDQPNFRRDTAMRGDGWTRLIAALVALVLAILTIPGTEDFPLDDAWIHLSYAKSLRLGDGLSYNPGDWETGFSSPVWVALLAMWPTSGAPVLPVKLLGALLHGATAWLAAHVVLDLVRQRASTAAPLPAQSMALLGGIFAASAPSLLQASTSGMEVPLTAAAILAVTAAMIAGAPLAAGLTGCLAVLCRPEALGFVLTLGTVLALARRRARQDTSPATRMPSSASVRAAVVGPLGALLGLGLWVMWCWSVSEYPWPNTQYIKGTGGGLAGLSFLADDVLPWQPWVVSLTGVVLVALGVRHDVRHRHYELLALLAAVLATWLAIAVTRPLHPGVGFYETRYFVPFGAPVAVVLPFGLLACRRWLAWVLLLPLALLTGLQIPQLRSRLVEQASDTRTVHTAVARTIASQLPADATVAVEGAGATRYFTPRTMTILDIVGLNDRVAAHLHFDRRAKMCHFVRQAPTHFAIPADWLPQFEPVFAMRPIARFDDPRYTQVQPPRPLTVVLTAVDAIHPAWVQGCAVSKKPAATARPQ